MPACDSHTSTLSLVGIFTRSGRDAWKTPGDSYACWQAKLGEQQSVIGTGYLKLQVSLTDTFDMTGIPSRIEQLGTAIRFAESEHSVISQNIANVNTPHYKTLEMSFDDFLESARHNNPDSHSKGGDGIRMARGLVERTDGNNVDLDREMARLKQNALLFRTLSQLLMSQMDIMRKAMTS